MKIRKMLIGILLIIFSIGFNSEIANALQLNDETNIQDNVGVISDTSKIESKVKEFEDKTHTDAFVYITDNKDTTPGSIDQIYNSIFVDERGVLIAIAINDKYVQIRTGGEVSDVITDKYCERMIDAAEYDLKYSKYDDGICDILDEGIRKYENKDGTLLQKFMHSWFYGVLVIIAFIALSVWSWCRRLNRDYKRRLNGGSGYYGGGYHHHHFGGGSSGGGGRGGSSGGW